MRDSNDKQRASVVRLSALSELRSGSALPAYKRITRIATALLWLAAAGAQAQNPGQTPGTAIPQPDRGEGVNYAGYQVQQAIEFGGRITELNGSSALYNTFTNLQSGPRLLEQSLSMQSRNHEGIAFDTLRFNSFGWGGDPHNLLRFTASKDHWYQFDSSFRRTQYFWDYDLIANPLNPPTSNPAIPVTTSPHSFYLRHRMYDYNLTLLPQKFMSVRLGFSRNRSEGPSFSSVHVGTDALLNQLWNTTSNQYRIGLDVRPLAHTNISYDQFLKYYKGDTGYSLAPFATFRLSNGTPVEFGLPWDTANNAPCASPLTGGVANPTCNSYMNYSRTQRLRGFIPTEQLTIQSREIRNLELTGRVQYSSADMDTPFNELFTGLDSRLAVRQEQNTASTGNAKWVSVVTELGATYRITDRLRLMETFRFNNWRIPGSLILNELAFFNASSVPAATSLQPIATFPGSSLRHTTSSPADVIVGTYGRFLGENDRSNEFRVEYDFTSRLGASLGYRFGRRFVHYRDSLAENLTFYPLLPNRGACAGVPLNPDGTCTTSTFLSGAEEFTINEHTGLLTIWANPTDALRLNFNVAVLNADDFVTRISPTHQQQYRARASYAPNSWLNLGATMNILERRNPFELANKFLGHVRDYGFNAMLSPNERFTLDLAYNFSDFLENQIVCFARTPILPGSTLCPLGTGLRQAPGNYNNHTHFGSFLVLFRPVNRVRASAGYNITNVDGNTLILNPLQPLGPLAFRYHQPMASVSVELAKHWAWNVGWNYDQYNEQGAVGPTAPRYFHNNRTTLSLRYAF